MEECFESSHEHRESLYKMDGAGRLVFPVVMVKNRSGFSCQFQDLTTKKQELSVVWKIKWQHFEKF